MHLARRTPGAACRIALVAVLIAGAPAAAVAQAGGYPAFQPPRIVDREFNFGVADGDIGTTLVFQWREGWSPVSQLSFDLGFTDPDGGDLRMVLGAGYARQFHRETADLPLDLMFTLGAYTSFGDGTIFQVPVGVVIGHRFPLEGQLAITPYAHPRLALQYCSFCDAGDSETDVGVAFDIGADFELSEQLSLRLGFAFGDDLNEAVGFSLAWRPRGLRR